MSKGSNSVTDIFLKKNSSTPSRGAKAHRSDFLIPHESQTLGFLLSFVHVVHCGERGIRTPGTRKGTTVFRDPAPKRKG